MNPLVSIVMPTLNAGKTVGRALQSLQNQSYKNIEVILADGASTDDTLAVAKQFGPLVSTVISEKDRGNADALNKGFARVNGEILCWLCADDELLPSTLEHVVNHFALAPEIDIITGGCARIYPDESLHITVPPANAVEVMGAQYRIEQPSTFWRSRVMPAKDPMDLNLPYAFDWDFFVRLTRPPARTLILSDVMSKYHFSTTNKTSNGGRKLIMEMREIVRRHGPLEGRLADVFFFLYRNFDLGGCYDRPPACSPQLGRQFHRVMNRLELRYPKELLYLYNWNFASRQERKLVWYK